LNYIALQQHERVRLHPLDDEVFVLSSDGSGWFKVFTSTNDVCMSNEISPTQMQISDDGRRIVLLQCGKYLQTYNRIADGDFSLTFSQELDDPLPWTLYSCQIKMSNDGRHLIIYGDCETDNSIRSFKYTDNGWELFAINYIPEKFPTEYKQCDLSYDGTRGVFAVNNRPLGFFPDTLAMVYVVEFSLGDPNGVDDNYEADVKVYPNPTSDIITIEFPKEEINKKGKIKAKLYDGFGREVYLSKPIGRFPTKIDVSHLSKGIYSLIIFDEGGNALFRQNIAKQ
jgi:hypothetical protein